MLNVVQTIAIAIVVLCSWSRLSAQENIKFPAPRSEVYDWTFLAGDTIPVSSCLSRGINE